MRKIAYIIAAVLIIGTIYVNRGINSPNSGDATEREFVIASGDGVGDIATKLHEQNFLERPLVFETYILLNGLKSSFWSGTYRLRGNMNIVELAASLTSQKNIIPEETSITIIEGWRVDEIDAYLAEKNLIKAGEVIDFSDKYNGDEYEFLKERPRGADLEGYLYPDTYRVYSNAGVASIMKKMLDNFSSKLSPDLLVEINKQNRTLPEVLTLASIVEQEMHGYENRQRVAGVFLNRLKINMALQSDATVNYITKSGRSRSTLDDLEIDNPYNTYKYPGLPPGPICNPSLEAIKAVIYPKVTGDLYFLTGKDGNIYFAKTFEEHVANKQKYLY